ncbi:MAG: phosphotransferase [Gammaproteobacteria bacterium]|nr:phosphotransferase [Gammaproteobacteria bacterium]
MEPDAAWLGTLLGADVVDLRAEVLGVFSSEVSRLHISYRRDAKLPTSLILKRPHADRQTRIGESFALEGRFYKEVAGQLDARLPRCWAQSDDYILLEDVDYQPFDWHAGATLHHTKTALDTLRQIHAVQAPPTWIPNFADATFRGRLSECFDRAWSLNRRIFNDMFPEFTLIGDALVGQGHACLRPLGDHQGLLHGDAHLENLPLRPAGGRAAVFDWQGPRIGNGLFDVAYFLVMSHPPRQRHEIEMQMLEYYLGHPPTSGERRIYAIACLARGAAIVELTADWRPQPFSNANFNWVFERCLQGAVDHAGSLD